MLRKRREDSGSPNPHIPLGHKRANGAESSDDDKKDDESTSSEDESKKKGQGTWAAVEQSAGDASASPSLKPNGAPAMKLQPLIRSSNLNTVFGEEEEEVNTLHVIKKKLKPFEITREVN